MPDLTRPAVSPERRRRGCLGCGCAVLIAFILLNLGLLAVLIYEAYRTAVQYTGTSPVTIENHDGGPEVYAAAEKKIAAFEQAFAQQQPATLRLSGDEISTLVARDPAYAGTGGRLAVTLQGDTATLQGSAPLGSFEKQLLPERYLNGSATFGLSVDPATHLLAADLQSVKLNGQTLPSATSAGFNQMLNQALNQRLQENQLARDFMARVQRAGIENGELVIEIR